MSASASLSAKPILRRERILFWCGCMVFFFLIMLCAPYTYDDFEFASLKFASFGELLQYCLTYGNGRILGNVFGVLGNQLPVFSAVCKAVVLSTTVILIPEILGLRSILSYILSFLLTTAIDPALFAQVITWNSGFHNYVPPVFLMLCALWLIQRFPADQGHPIVKTLYCIGLYILGLCAQLYVEHSSVINVMLALVIFIKTLHDAKPSRRIPALFLLCGTITGLLLLFWIPSHFLVNNNNHTTGYRSLYTSSITAFVYNCARNTLRLANHYFGMTGVPLCAGAAISVYLTKDSRKSKANSILYSCSIIPGLYMLVCSLMNYEGWYAELAIIHHAIAMLAVFCALAVWVIALLGAKDLLFRNRTLLLLGLAVFSLLPLLLVTPIRIRVVYHSQIFVVMAFLLCFMQWAQSWKGKIYQTVVKGTAFCAAVLIVSMGSVFISIRGMDQARNKYTLQQIAQGAEVVDFFRFPYDLVHDDTDPLMGKYYYRNEPYDVAFNIKPFDEWMNDNLGTIK